MLFHFCGSPSPNFGESANNIHECAIDNANNAKIILAPFMRTLTNQYFFGRNIFFWAPNILKMLVTMAPHTRFFAFTENF